MTNLGLYSMIQIVLPAKKFPLGSVTVGCSTEGGSRKVGNKLFFVRPFASLRLLGD